MLSLGSWFVGLLDLGDDCSVGSVAAVSVLVAIFSGQGPTNFLVGIRDTLLSSIASGKHYWYS